MKTFIRTMMLSVFASFTFQTNAQIDSLTADSLIRNLVDTYDPSGVISFIPNSLKSGEIFTLYKSYFANDQDNSFVKYKSHVDPFVGMTHDRFRQYYKGIAVEGATMIEHHKDGFTSAVNGKLTLLDKPIDGVKTMEEALEWLSNEYDGWQGNQLFAWEDPEWEQDLKDESGNPDTSYAPTFNAELLWAVHDYDRLGYHIPQENLSLAWRFEILSVTPLTHKAYYVDAIKLDIIKITNLFPTDGPANINHYGSVTLDTKKRFPQGDYKLTANENGRKVETRFQTMDGPDYNSWSGCDKILDENDNWGSSHILGTTVHWMGTQIWDYFDETFDHRGFNGNGKELKIRADVPNYNNSGYSENTIWVGTRNNNYLGVLDVLAHEFGHGVTNKFVEFAYEKESGALDESFADIFGYLVELYVEGGSSDWLIGEDVGNPAGFRSMLNPTWFPYEDPDTYEKTIAFWVDVNGCVPEGDENNINYNDYCGVHTNSGVQNRWFSLIAIGGTHNGVTVPSIGADDAAKIAYHALTDWHTEYSNYQDARNYSVYASIILFGLCSQQNQATELAWDAVQVDGQFFCLNTSVQETFEKSKIRIFPNPTSNAFSIDALDNYNATISVYSIDGRLIETFSISGNKVVFGESYKSGVYIVRFKLEDSIISQTLIKN